MSRDNDQSRNTGPGENEYQSPQTFRDTYLNAINQNRSRQRASDLPEDNAPEIANKPERGARPRNTRGSERVSAEDADRPAPRPRPARQSRAEVEARLRQRPRRSQEEAIGQTAIPPRRQLPSRREPTDNSLYEQARAPRDIPSRRSAQRDEEEYNMQEDDTEVPVQRRRRRPPEDPLHRHKGRRGGRVFSNVLIGCVGGVITLAIVIGVVAFLILHNTPLGQNLNIGKSAYPQQGQQSLTLGSATQLIVKNQIGNISINVDPSATSATLASLKHVEASSQSDANNQFKQIILAVKQISQGGDPACLASTCLLISATVPTAANGGTLGTGNGDSIDLALDLPSSFNPAVPTSLPNTITVADSTGNITVNGFNGLLDLSGQAGATNIHVTHSLIYAGSCIQTTSGNINIDQESNFNVTLPSNLVPCSNTTSTSEHFWFSVISGKGNVDITFTSSINLALNASVNNGQITDDFNLNIVKNDGSPGYTGPLLSNTNPTASLYLTVSTGNIGLHKQ